MMKLTAKSPHIFKVSWSDIRQHVSQVNPQVAKALDQVVQGNVRKTPLPMYVARYRYGQPIVISSKDQGRQFYTPCHTKDCADCNGLRSACEGQIPFGILLHNAAETYSEDQSVTAGQRSSVPIRMVHPGETFGVITMMQRMQRLHIQPSGFNWSLSAGARTVVCSFPVGDRQLVKNILHRATGTVPSVEAVDSARVAFEFDNQKLIFELLAAAQRENQIEKLRLDWHLDILLIPASVMEKLCYGKDGTDNLLMTVLKNIALKSLASFKNYSEIDGQIAWIISGIISVPKNIYLQRTITHILAILNGIKPGFRPVTGDEVAGPFMGLLRYIWSTGLAKSPGLKGRFPLLLQPDQLSEDHRPVLYYSVQEPTVPGPLEKKNGTRASSLWNLQRCLLEIEKKGPMLLPNDLRTTFLSAQAGGNGTGDSSQTHIEHIRSDFGLLKDFNDQWLLAQELWKMNSTASFFQNVKQEFMAAFVRFQFGEPAQAQVIEKAAS